MITSSPAPPPGYHRETFAPGEEQVLLRYFTNTHLPVFGLINLPEVVKGALFARYSRTHKSVRRLFLDEFYDALEASPDDGANADRGVQTDRADNLYQKVFTEYGDDSVAQLGGVHLACEQASNLLTKVLERGRLAAYLEQSTRYIFYDRKLGERYRYSVPPEIGASPLAGRYVGLMEGLFDLYSRLIARLVPYYESLHPRRSDDPEFAWRATIRARACDTARGLLPASTLSNVGIYATGQAYEGLLLRMRAHPFAEVRGYGELMLGELRTMIPAFVKRVDVPERGGAWSSYLAAVDAAMQGLADRLGVEPESRPEVTLVDWDPDGEVKVAAAALYAYADLADDQLLSAARQLNAADRARLIRTYVGDRANRRHKPGRGMERTGYRFDILCDYGIFRDLQRHRILTIDWQRLGVRHGFVTPPDALEVGAEEEWSAAMEQAAAFHVEAAATLGLDVAQYAVPFAYRVRFFLQLNAREAFHLLELRTARGGHPDYRRVCREMHRLIGERAGHRLIADAMRFVDYEDYDLGRLDGERRAAARRAAAGIADPAP